MRFALGTVETSRGDARLLRRCATSRRFGGSPSPSDGCFWRAHRVHVSIGRLFVVAFSCWVREPREWHEELGRVVSLGAVRTYDEPDGTTLVVVDEPDRRGAEALRRRIADWPFLHAERDPVGPFVFARAAASAPPSERAS